MGSIQGGGPWKAVVIQDGDGAVKIAQWLPYGSPDPTASELQSLASAYSINANTFGAPVTARVLEAMRPGPYWTLLDNDQYQQLAGINADGTIGTQQTNADPNGDTYGITLQDLLRDAPTIDFDAEILTTGDWIHQPR